VLVQRVVMPGSLVESWTVLGEGGGPVEPIERYLAYLTDVEKSPNTVKAYAHDLKDWFVFLVRRGLDWREVRLEDLGEFVAWLRLPPAGRSGGVALLPSAQHHCGVVTVIRKLSAVGGFTGSTPDTVLTLLIWSPSCDRCSSGALGGSRSCSIWPAGSRSGDARSS
jgi:integrase/recombinase XerD